MARFPYDATMLLAPSLLMTGKKPTAQELVEINKDNPYYQNLVWCNLFNSKYQERDVLSLLAADGNDGGTLEGAENMSFNSTGAVYWNHANTPSFFQSQASEITIISDFYLGSTADNQVIFCKTASDYHGPHFYFKGGVNDAFDFYVEATNNNSSRLNSTLTYTTGRYIYGASYDSADGECHGFIDGVDIKGGTSTKSAINCDMSVSGVQLSVGGNKFQNNRYMTGNVYSVWVFDKRIPDTYLSYLTRHLYEEMLRVRG